MVIKNKFFKTYFIIMIVYAIIGLLDALVFSGTKENFGQISILWQIIAGIFYVFVFVLSIIALVLFIKNKFAKITLVIPIYHLIAEVLIFLYGVVWGIILVLQGDSISSELIPLGMVLAGVISSLFELIFSIYVLIKFTK